MNPAWPTYWSPLLLTQDRGSQLFLARQDILGRNFSAEQKTPAVVIYARQIALN